MTDKKMSPGEVEHLRRRAQEMLDDYTRHEKFDFHLKVLEEYDWLDGSLQLVAVPDRDGVPVDEYVEALLAVDRKLRRLESAQVLLVPALVD